MRPFCLLCILKHLSQADVLMDEASLGYPMHRWRAIGHMAEAESECLGFSVTLARRIRLRRLLYIDGEEVDLKDLISEVFLEYEEIKE